ncbi:hypothetical protein [Celeribacter neptunius]|nr:hypothetical protein [Celeribacter neptunius]
MRVRMGIAGLLVLGLSACEMELPSSSVAPPPRSVTLSQSNVSVAGPSGFCVDPGSIRDTPEGGFVLLGNCGGLSGRSNPALKGKTAMLTLSVTAPMQDPEQFDTPSLEAFFRSEAGRRTLSRAGAARTVTVIESAPEAETLWLHARDSAPGALPGQGAEYWRALFLLDGRLVTATATPFAEAPMPEAQLRGVLSRFVAELKRRNRTMS